MAPAPVPKGRFDTSGRFGKPPGSSSRLSDDENRRRAERADPADIERGDATWSTGDAAMPRPRRKHEGMTDEQRAQMDEMGKDWAPGQPGGKVGRAQADQKNTWRKAGRSVGGGAKAVASGGASDGAGFVLGLIVYAVGLNFIRGGWPAVAGWFGAKFINKPYTAPLSQVTPAPGGNLAGPDQPLRQFRGPGLGHVE